MASLNKVFLIGNLTRDPETRYLPSGTAVGDLRMAVSRKYKTQQGEEKEETCFVSVSVWGRQAETCNQYLSKGSPVMVEGRLRYEEWEKDGQKNNRLSVTAERVQFMGSPRSGTNYGDAPDAAASAYNAAAPAPASPRPAAPPPASHTPSYGGASDAAAPTPSPDSEMGNEEDLPF